MNDLVREVSDALARCIAANIECDVRATDLLPSEREVIARAVIPVVRAHEKREALFASMGLVEAKGQDLAETYPALVDAVKRGFAANDQPEPAGRRESTKEHNMDNPGHTLSFGQRAVGITFNPGGREDVNACKLAFAAEIDRMDALRSDSESPEQCRLASVAITELQTAQMWAVKALTWTS